MLSFRETRKLLLFAFTKGIVKADKFALLYDLNTSKNPPFPYDSYEDFSLNNFSDEEWKAEFRVEKSGLPVLSDALGIPAVFRCPQRSVCSGMEGLCLLLKRLAYPCRYSDMIHRFGRSVPEISMMTNVVGDWIYQEHGHLLTDFNQPFLSRASLRTYADAIHDKGSALNNCWGFIDGTVRPICRPNENQRIVYNGHKFQSVVTPNGLIANLHGPVEGRKHDSGMLADSGIYMYNDLARNSFDPAGNPLRIYGDPAYPLRVHLQVPFKYGILTRQMKDFNKSMSAVRVSVEWLFGDIIGYFKHLDFKKDLKIGLSSVGKFYAVAALLRNALTCLYGNTTAIFFNLILQIFMIISPDLYIFKV